MSKGGIGDPVLPVKFWPANVPETLGAPKLPLHEVLVTRWARETPDSPVFQMDEKVFTYRQLEEASNAVANLISTLSSNSSLSSPSQPARTKAAIILTNSFSLVAALFGSMKSNCYVTIIDISQDLATIQAELNDLRPDIIFIENSLIQLIRQSATDAKVVRKTELDEIGRVTSQNFEATRVGRDIPLIALYKQIPKGVVRVQHSHNTVLSSTVSFISFLGVNEKDVTLLCTPLGQWQGFLTLVSAMYWGGRVACSTTSDATQLIQEIQKSKITYLLLSAETAESIARSIPFKWFSLPWKSRSQKLASLRWIGVCTEGRKMIDRRVQDHFEKATSLPLLQMYGLPETFLLFSNHWSWNVHNSIGIPVTNVKPRLVDPNTGKDAKEPWDEAPPSKLLVSGPIVMKAYSDDEMNERFLTDGWFDTDQLVQVDPNGIFYLASQQRIQSATIQRY